MLRLLYYQQNTRLSDARGRGGVSAAIVAQVANRNLSSFRQNQIALLHIHISPMALLMWCCNLFCPARQPSGSNGTLARVPLLTGDQYAQQHNAAVQQGVVGVVSALSTGDGVGAAAPPLVPSDRVPRGTVRDTRMTLTIVPTQSSDVSERGAKRSCTMAMTVPAGQQIPHVTIVVTERLQKAQRVTIAVSVNDDDDTAVSTSGAICQTPGQQHNAAVQQQVRDLSDALDTAADGLLEIASDLKTNLDFLSGQRV